VIQLWDLCCACFCLLDQIFFIVIYSTLTRLRCICEQVVFAGFSAEALSQRILDCRPNFVLTTSGVRRGSKVIKLKEIVDDALQRVLSEGFAVGMPFTVVHQSVKCLL
jgi:acyl-coenzyme A synthetase/AMP-(fatty) acid ligase